MARRTKKELRATVATAKACRRFLSMTGFLSESENLKVAVRIWKFQDKHNIRLSEAQEYSVRFDYNDDAEDKK